MHTVRLQSCILVLIFARMCVGNVMDACKDFCNWYFLHECCKSYLNAYAKTHALAGWKDFMDHDTAFPVQALLLLW